MNRSQISLGKGKEKAKGLIQVCTILGIVGVLTVRKPPCMMGTFIFSSVSSGRLYWKSVTKPLLAVDVSNPADDTPSTIFVFIDVDGVEVIVDVIDLN